MSTKNILCPVDVGDSFGEYANAFRVMQDGTDVLLDFCVYSEEGNTARLVSRVRVTPDFLRVMLERLHHDTTPDEEIPCERGGLLILPRIAGEN